MAENDQEKTDYQSQKKLEQSREKGELPRSQELGTFVVFSIFLVFFSLNRLSWFDGLGGIMSDMLSFDRYMDLQQENLGEFLLRPFFQAALMMAPLFAMVLFISPLISMIQTGFNLAKNKLEPNWERMDPVAGLKRMVSARQWIEGLKSTLKVGMFAFLAYMTIKAAIPDIKTLSGMDLLAQLNTLMNLALKIGIRIAILMAILAVFDLGYQWYDFTQKLRMTHQEMKDEMKEREGDPMIKQRIRSMQMQQARRRMMSEVPKADVVVTNPTHFAVAIRYDKNKAPAPYVCAKGTEHMAQRIKKVARENGVPVIENKPLARALYRQVKVNQMIPNEFFKAIAELLALVYFMKRRGRFVGSGSLNTRQPARPASTLTSRYF